MPNTQNNIRYWYLEQFQKNNKKAPPSFKKKKKKKKKQAAKHVFIFIGLCTAVTRRKYWYK